MRSRRHPHIRSVEAPSLTLPGLEPGRVQQVIDADRWCSQELSALAAVVGGIDTLEDLPLEPVIEEPFDWQQVPDDDDTLVRTVLERIEQIDDWVLDTESSAILRRLIARAAAHDAHPLRRRSSPERIAAALVWITLKGNMAVGRRQRLSGEMLWYILGVTSCAELGRRIAEAMDMTATVERFPSGGKLPCDPVALGDAELLTSQTRQWIVRQRDQNLDVYTEIAARELAAKPVVYRGNGKVEVRGRGVNVVGALKGMHGGSRATVMVLLGETADDIDDVLALSVPDAHRLVAQLQSALDEPLQLPR